MRQITTISAAAILMAAVAGTAPAKGAPVLVLDGGKVRTKEERALDGSANRLSAYPGPACSACRARGRASERRRGQLTASDAVRRAVERAARSGQIEQADRGSYLRTYSAALNLRGRLGGQRHTELSSVISNLGQIARAGRLNAGRMPALFLILERNNEWWAKKGPPASGARVSFGDSRVLFQYFPGQGLQFHPLGNFGLANGYWQGHKDKQLRSLIDDLVALRVNRSAFTTWEYYFHFGGGAPPWISGMAQATAMQAIARAGARLDDRRLIEIAGQGLGAFERRTPLGVRVPAGSGAWYALYSFDPAQRVLNGMLQALIGLNAYGDHAKDERARALFAEGDRVARARIDAFDTGAWSLYSHPGSEANLNYHTLNRDFSRRLCRITEADAYCKAADNFSRYLKEDPDLAPFGPAPAPAKAGRRVRLYFTLSKVGRVGITVSGPGEASTSRTYLSTSASFSRGKHFFTWIPPRRESERTYAYKLSARDLAGNSSAETGTVRVKPG